MNPIVLSALIVAGIGLIAGVGLAIASAVFAVPNERLEKVSRVLPGANCGSCGYSGCSAYAEAVVKGEAETGLCRPGGEAVAKEIAAIMGTEAVAVDKKHAVVMCRGGSDVTAKKMNYVGLDSCAAAVSMCGGPNRCRYGCEGFGDCIASCAFDALRMVGGVPTVDVRLCTGCGKCVSACPKSLITLISAREAVAVRCKSHYPDMNKEAACQAGCHTCGKCEELCPADSIKIIDNLPVIDYERCVGCRVCTMVCPSKVLQSIDD